MRKYCLRGFKAIVQIIYIVHISIKQMRKGEIFFNSLFKKFWSSAILTFEWQCDLPLNKL